MKHNPGFLRQVESVMARVTEVAIEAIPPGATLVDVREDSEWAAGHVPGAVHLGRGVLERDVETRFPDPTAPLVLYCGGGYRSALAADTLQQMGYTNVTSLVGGWKRWNDLGRPVEK